MFRDAFAVDWEDDSHDNGEVRFDMVGMVENRLLFVAYTLRATRIRIISARLSGMKPSPRLKIIRRALGLTQEEFSARFHIPLGTLRDWEQGATRPDQTARAYLGAIAGNAAAVQMALESSP